MKKYNTTAITIAIMVLGFTFSSILPAFAGTWRDDFEDDKTTEWEIYNLDKRLEKWWIDDGEAVGEIFSPGFWSLWLAGDSEWENYSVSCRAMLDDDRNEPPSVGLTLHDRGDEGSRYVFLLDYVINQVTIIKDVLGGSGVAFPYVPEKGVWYDLKATVFEDGTLEFQVNDSVFTAVDPQPLEGGKAGLVIGDARARFDNFAVTGDNVQDGGPGKPFDVAPRAKLATTWGSLKMK